LFGLTETGSPLEGPTELTATNRLVLIGLTTEGPKELTAPTCPVLIGLKETTEVSSTYTTFSTKTAMTTIAKMTDTMIAMMTAMTTSLTLHLLVGYNVYLFISTAYLGSHYLHQN
jgi:hypothetical protein